MRLRYSFSRSPTSLRALTGLLLGVGVSDPLTSAGVVALLALTALISGAARGDGGSDDRARVLIIATRLKQR